MKPWLVIIFWYFIGDCEKLIRINQLPIFVARWQRGFSICFATFILSKIEELLITNYYCLFQNKASTDSESSEFEKNFEECLTKMINNQILTDKIRHRYQVGSNLLGDTSPLLTKLLTYWLLSSSAKSSHCFSNPISCSDYNQTSLSDYSVTKLVGFAGKDLLPITK